MSDICIRISPSRKKTGQGQYSCTRFLVCPKRLPSSVQLRLIIYRCESPTDIAAHCSLHPERGW